MLYSAIKNAIAVVGRGVVPFLDKVQLCRKAGAHAAQGRNCETLCVMEQRGGVAGAVAVVIVNTDDSILECAGGVFAATFYDGR